MKLKIIKHNTSSAIKLSELYQFRFFLLQLIYRNLSLIYKQTILGPLWQIINPIIQSGLFTLIFSNFAKLPTDNIPPYLFYSSGMLLWVFFYSTILKVSNQFINSAYLIRFLYFPKILIPISLLIENLFFFLIQFLIFVVIYLLFSFNGYSFLFNFNLFLIFPLVVIFVGIFATSIGMIVSCLSAKYRDWNQFIIYGVNLMFYVTPIVYSFSSVPDKYKILFYFNPITFFIEFVKNVFFSTSFIPISYLISGVCIAIFTIIISIKIFKIITRNIIDYV